MTAKWSRWRDLEARFVTILTVRFKGALVPAWPADRSHTRTGPVEADGAVDAQNAPTAPWKTLRVFHELPQGFPHQITHDKPRKSPESYWETRIDPLFCIDVAHRSRLGFPGRSCPRIVHFFDRGPEGDRCGQGSAAAWAGPRMTTNVRRSVTCRETHFKNRRATLVTLSIRRPSDSSTSASRRAGSDSGSARPRGAARVADGSAGCPDLGGCVRGGNWSTNSRTARRREPSPIKTNRSTHDSLMVRTNRSANAFTFGDRGGRRTGVTPPASSVSRTS